MMAWYEVEVIGESREVYSLEAVSPEDAKERWSDGKVILSEVTSAEPVSAREAD